MRASAVIDMLLELIDNIGDVEVVFSTQQGRPIQTDPKEELKGHYPPKIIGLHSRH